MIAFRIALRKYGNTARNAFSGLSGMSADGRWHTGGRFLDYAAESRSLATLERLVHYRRFSALEPHVIYVVDVPDRHITTIPKLPVGWNRPLPLRATQAMGDAWCDSMASPALKVPSAISPGEHNLMVNTHHPDWDWKWVVDGPKVFRFEPRLVEMVKRARERRGR